MNRSFEERVIPEGYKVENNELVAPTLIHHRTDSLHPDGTGGEAILIRDGN